MAIYKRSDSQFYSYDFQVDGTRYSGTTGKKNVEAARAYEAKVRGELTPLSTICRAIIRRAKNGAGRVPASTTGSIYMIQSGYFVKIGFATDPAERIRAIQTGAPEECELLFCIRGDMKLERRLHAEFAACHHRGEWFFLCGRLRHFVQELRLEMASDADRKQAVPQKSHA